MAKKVTNKSAQPVKQAAEVKEQEVVRVINFFQSKRLNQVCVLLYFKNEQEYHLVRNTTAGIVAEVVELGTISKLEIEELHIKSERPYVDRDLAVSDDVLKIALKLFDAEQLLVNTWNGYLPSMEVKIPITIQRINNKLMFTVDSFSATAGLIRYLLKSDYLLSIF